MYVFLISYVALVLVPYADLSYVFSLLHVVKSAYAFVMVILIIKLTQQFLNNLTL
jgi:chromate transport protein ChrA